MKTSYVVPIGTITLTEVSAPIACIAALANIGAGNLNNGGLGYNYRITFITAVGETELGTASNTVIIVDNTTNGQIRLTNIPVGSAGTKVIQRKIYRTKIIGGGTYWYLATLADNTTTTYIDNTSDAGLGADSTNLNNTTAWFYVNSTKAGLLGETNTLFGRGAGINITTGSSNSAFGSYALSSITTGIGNTVVGDRAGFLNNGRWNTFIGSEAGYSNITDYNTFVGWQSGKKNTTGQFNTYLGNSAGRENIASSNNTIIGYLAGLATTGGNNTLIGSLAGRHNTAGLDNVFIGSSAGYSNISDDNVFVGFNAGYSYSGTAYRNVAIGSVAGSVNTAGSFNTYLGTLSGYIGTTDGLSNTTCIGYNTQVTSSNSCILGNGQNVGIGTTAPTSPLQVVGLPVYANNAAAVAGGLTVGAFYRNGADPDLVCVVH